MSVPPDDRDTELRAVFFESAQDLVQRMNDEALRLERTPGDPEAARSLRRIVHTLKGDAAACNLRELSELAHAIEDMFALDTAEATPQIPGFALRAADCFSALLGAYRDNTSLPDLDPFRDEISQLVEAHAATRGRDGKDEAASSASHWTEYEQLAIARALKNGKSVYAVSVELDLQSGMPVAAHQLLMLALADMGEVLALYPPGTNGPALVRIEAAIESMKSPEQIQTKCTIPTVSRKVSVTPLRNIEAPVQLLESMSPQDEDNRAKEAMQAAKTTGDAQPGPEQATRAVAAPENILRVDAERIDSALNLVGELILAKSMLQQAVSEFAHRFPTDSLRGKLSDLMAFQARILNDLQRSVMKIRMVPVEQLFRRFPRVVRDVAHDCGKEVGLISRGGETDIDKGILDALAEPLTHLLRNAVGHGQETAAERTLAGKPAHGTVQLSAYHQGNQVIIEVSDDGRGIQVDKVRARAVTRGIMKAEDAARLSDAECLRLILRPGFSTAQKVTELSGRGIGLDVVDSGVARLKGTLEIETEAGRGTTFRLRLPLTLSIIRALLFRVERQLYALPLSSVAEITRTTEDKIHSVEQYEALHLRDQILPLLRMSSAPIDSTPSNRKAFVLVVSHGERRFGMMVDELAGEEELVIKALDDRSITTDLVSGGSILGDGRVVLILNVAALAERLTRGRIENSGALLRSSAHPMRREQQNQAHTAAGGQA